MVDELLPYSLNDGRRAGSAFGRSRPIHLVPLCASTTRSEPTGCKASLRGCPSSSCSTGFFVAVRTDHNSLLVAARAGDVQGAADAVAVLDAAAHAGVDQEQKTVALEEALLLPVSFVGKLHVAILMTLHKVLHPRVATYLARSFADSSKPCRHRTRAGRWVPSCSGELREWSSCRPVPWLRIHPWQNRLRCPH